MPLVNAADCSKEFAFSSNPEKIKSACKREQHRTHTNGRGAQLFQQALPIGANMSISLMPRFYRLNLEYEGVVCGLLADRLVQFKLVVDDVDQKTVCPGFELDHAWVHYVLLRRIGRLVCMHAISNLIE